MKHIWNRTTNTPSIIFEESDYVKLAEVAQIVAGVFSCKHCSNTNQIKGWQYLKEFFAGRRQRIDDEGKYKARTRVGKDVCSNYFSMLDGFDMSSKMAEEIMMQIKLLEDLNLKTRELQEAQNGSDDDGE